MTFVKIWSIFSKTIFPVFQYVLVINYPTLFEKCDLRLPFTLERIEIEIFAEYKYTLNKLPVKIFFFNTSKNSLRDMVNERFYRK